MDVGHPTPETPEPELPLSIRFLWPEVEPDADGKVDHESAILAERRAKTFRAFTRGRSMRQIEEELKTSKSTACRDVNFVLDSYRLVALQDAAAHVARELGRLATIETDLWDVWERSKADAVETTTGKRDGWNAASDARVRKRQRDGDTRVMRLIIACWDRRCKLLGLLKADDFRGKDGLPPVKYVRGVDPVEAV